MSLPVGITGFTGLLVTVSTSFMVSSCAEDSVYAVNEVVALGLVSMLAFLFTMKLIPVVKEKCLKAGLFGRDINKNGKDPVPEALGIVPATVSLMAIISFQWVFRENLGEFNAAIIAMSMMLFLGFADDVLDVRWRDKVLLSYMAAVPLLFGYSGETTIVLPKQLEAYFGSKFLDLGILYYAYMINTIVWCTNAINIYAGINGLETGQTVVMAAFVLLHNCIQLAMGDSEGHLLSIFIVLPFLTSGLALTYFNWYPSQVFVGDTFTYFAGMTLAVCGIIGHFSRTLVVLFIPQIINFLLSIPQLLHIIECPRHRLPRYDASTGKLYYTKNGTLINAWLYLFGPRTEKELCVHLVGFQILCCSAGLFLRYYLSAYFY